MGSTSPEGLWPQEMEGCIVQCTGCIVIGQIWEKPGTPMVKSFLYAGLLSAFNLLLFIVSVRVFNYQNLKVNQDIL